MNFFGISDFSVGILSLFMAVFILIKGRSSRIGRIWAVYSIATSIWGFGGAKISTINDADSAFLWWQLTYTGIIFMPILFFHFVCAFLNIKRRLYIIFSYIIGLIFLFFNLASRELFIGSVKYVFSQFYWVNPPGPLLNIFVVFMVVGLVGYGHLEMYFTLRKTQDNTKRTHLKYFLIGSIIAWLGGYACFLPCYDIMIYPYGALTASFYVLIVGYTILNYKLFDIEVIVKKTLVFAGLFGGIYAVIAGFTFLSQVVFDHITGGNRWISLIPSIVIIVLILRPLENLLIRVTDKFLFQKRYDYKELLKTFTTEVLTVLDKGKLLHTTADRLTSIMKIESCGVLLFNKADNKYKLAASVGVDKHWRNMILEPDNTLASFLERTKTYLSTKHQGKDSPLPKRIVEDMNKLKLELAIPLVIHEDMIGILTLGKKKSDEEYTQDDMDILLPLARTLAIAISNAQVLDELAKTQAEAAQREKMAVIGTLSAGINHEICNPLGIARGQCEAFLLNIREGLYKDKTEKELLDKAQLIMNKVIHETDRATIITKRLSSFAKPSKGLYSEDIDVKESVNEVLALVGYEMKLDKIEVENNVPDKFPHITGDRKQIQEVFFNLIRNAAQAIHEKGKIAVKAYKNPGKAYIEIEDTGHGIPEDKVDQIFNPFYTTKEPGKGTGLGLFIVKQVVERNGGRISVKSKEGVGTTFTLEFGVSEKATL